MNKLLINTPQNVNFEYNLASLGSRILAFGIDFFIIILYYILAFTIISKSRVLNSLDDWSAFAIISLMTLPALLYPLLLETFMRGQTIGKKIMKIKVVKIDGTRATIYQYFIRWISNTVDIFITMGGLGMTAIILSKKSQRLGDMAADTAVISIKDNLYLKDTLYQEITKNHSIIYPEVINLTDKDINDIKEILGTAYRRKDFVIIESLATKLKQLLNISPKDNSDTFIRDIIRDHYFMFRDQ